MNVQCFRCRGRNFCDRPFCVIYEKIRFQRDFNDKAKKDFFGTSQNVFIGKYGYPNINVGLLNVEDDKEEYDNPYLWSSSNYDIYQIMKLRSSLVNSNFKANVKSFDDKFYEMSKEVSLAKKPVDIEVSLNKKPSFNLNFAQNVAPYGPSVKLEKARITENPKIPDKVDKVVDDIDLKASEGISTLYKKGFDEHYLTRIFSMGNLGVKTERKLVPTRWSITATDDIIGKRLIQEIKGFNESDYVAFYGGFLGNYYIIMLFPDVWSYELFETLVSTKDWTTDYEGYDGRKSYAFETAGGYYAARLPILEKLSEMKKQAGVLALRFVTDEYWAPLGVWVVREAVRKSLNSNPLVFESKELMLKYAEMLTMRKFNINTKTLFDKSRLLNKIKTQRKLVGF
jgi:hypothetical protein